MRNEMKITDVKVMIVRGADMILNQLKQLIMGEDPLNVDKVYTKMLCAAAATAPLRA
ncbi:MAG: hypothetical protein ACRD9L_19475 [Bryobacteraceae bacterium]